MIEKNEGYQTLTAEGYQTLTGEGYQTFSDSRDKIMKKTER